MLLTAKFSRSSWGNVFYPNTAPQLGHRLSFIAKQHNIPIGKNKIAQQTPRHVKSSSKTPICKKGAEQEIKRVNNVIKVWS